MSFGDYTKGATLAAELVNTVGSISGRDYLEDVSCLRELLIRTGMPVPDSLTERDVAEVRRVRERLRDVFLADTDEETVRGINALLRDHGATPRLTAAEEHAWRLEFAPSDAGLAHHVAAVAAIALAQLVHESGRARFGFCSAPDCRDVFIDTSRNRSRRYCTDSCSSRTNVAAYRARQRA